MSRTVTATEKLRAVNEGRLQKAEFVRQMRQLYPMYVSQFNGFSDTVQILKNKQILFEEKKDPVYDEPSYGYSDEDLQRGIDVELENMKLDSAGHISKEDQDKAKDKAIKNLNKDRNHYLNLISGESSKVDKHDKPVEVKKNNHKDTFNGMKKAELKEQIKEAVKELAGYNRRGEKQGETEPTKLTKIKDAIRQGIKADLGEEEVDEGGNIEHNCANHVMHEKYGHGICLEGEHTLSEDGTVSHYDVFFKEGSRTVENIPVTELQILTSSHHGHKRNKKKNEQMSADMMDKIKNYGKDKPSNKKSYELGDMWSDDFDYDGMLQAGLKVRISTPVEKLKSLYSSFEDVNYHSENKFLGRAIDAIEDGDKTEALNNIADFKKAVRKTIGGLNEGEYAANRFNVNVYGYQTKYYKICPGAKAFMEKVVAGEFGDTSQAKEETIKLGKLHDLLFLYEIKALKDSEYAQNILPTAEYLVKEIKEQINMMNGLNGTDIPLSEVDYLEGHIEKIKDAAEGVEETKGAPSGHYFTASGNLVKGRLTKAAREKGARLSDPKDKQRSKIPPVTQYNEGDLVGITDGHYAYIRGIIDILKTGEVPKDIGYRKEAIKALASLLREPDSVKNIDEADKNAIRKFLHKTYTDPKDPTNKVVDDEMIDGFFSVAPANLADMDMDDIKFEFDQYVDANYDALQEKKKDHDGDGDIDSDDYLAARDKAIKKAMGKDEIVKENVKAIIQKVLEEQTINEAATQELAKMGDSYAGFEGMKTVVMSLQDIVTDIERFYENTRDKIQKSFDAMGDVRNEEGLKVGGFLAPAVETAFNRDLRPVTKMGFTKGLDQPKVKVLTQADLDAAQMGGPVAEAEPKQTVFSPMNEKKK